MEEGLRASLSAGQLTGLFGKSPTAVLIEGKRRDQMTLVDLASDRTKMNFRLPRKQRLNVTITSPLSAGEWGLPL